MGRFKVTTLFSLLKWIFKCQAVLIEIQCSVSQNHNCPGMHVDAQNTEKTQPGQLRNFAYFQN